MRTDIVSSIASASNLNPDLISRAVVRPDSLKHGDFAFPAFALAKEWKLSPPECAKKLADTIVLPPGVDRVEVVGPYLNFFLNRACAAKDVIHERLLSAKKNSPKQALGNVVIDYSSPNIAKPFGVHHLRTTLIGESLNRIYKYLGYNVTSINHLGDWGTQFGYVWAGCKLWGNPNNPTVEDFVDLYVKASALRKQQEENSVPAEHKNLPDVNAMAREYFIKLEGGDKEATEFWSSCREISLTYLMNVYDRLGIHFDHFHGESFYRPMISKVEESVRKSGILVESKGALGVDLGKKLGFVRVFAEDGRSLYITRDIACATYRYDTFSPTKIIYVVAAQQSLHFQQLIEVMRLMKHPVADKMVHVSFGWVPGMKTREGGAIALKDFLDEAQGRALKAYNEAVQKRPEGVNESDVSERVAIGATYFYFLNHSNTKDFQFTWEQALNFQGDSGPYAQYAVARINSIIAKAKESGMSLDDLTFDSELLSGDDAYEVVSLLSQFEDAVKESARDYEPLHIAQYVLDLSRKFSSIYRDLRVVGEEPKKARAHLALFTAVRNVLGQALTLIGVPLIERM